MEATSPVAQPGLALFFLRPRPPCTPEAPGAGTAPGRGWGAGQRVRLLRTLGLRAPRESGAAPRDLPVPGGGSSQVLAAGQRPGDRTVPRAVRQGPRAGPCVGLAGREVGLGRSRGERAGRGSSRCQPAVACQGTCQGLASREARGLCQAVPARLGSDRLSWRAVQRQDETGLDLETQPGPPAGQSGRHVVSPRVRSPGGRPRAAACRRARVQGDRPRRRMLRVEGRGARGCVALGPGPRSAVVSDSEDGQPCACGARGGAGSRRRARARAAGPGWTPRAGWTPGAEALTSDPKPRRAAGQSGWGQRCGGG